MKEVGDSTPPVIGEKGREQGKETKGSQTSKKSEFMCG